MKLQALDSTKRNNFDAMRFFAASAVIFSHSYLVAGSFDSEPLNRYASFINFGSLSVYIFFIISGYLITKSLKKNLDLNAFIAARALRIFPGLIACIFFIGFILIPIATHQSIITNFSSIEFYRFISSNIIFPGSIQTIKNTFESNPFPKVINSSLWTLSWELLMYGAVLIIGIIKLIVLKRGVKPDYKAITLVTIYLLITYISLDKITKSGLQLILFFILGMLVFYTRKYLSIRYSIMFLIFLLICIFLVFQITGFKIVFAFALVYTVFFFGFHPTMQLGNFGRYGDFSYGLYIYSFPIQQALILNFPEINPSQLFILSFFASLPLAIISWKFVERPALSLKSKFTSQPVVRHA